MLLRHDRKPRTALFTDDGLVPNHPRWRAVFKVRSLILSSMIAWAASVGASSLAVRVSFFELVKDVGNSRTKVKAKLKK